MNVLGFGLSQKQIEKSYKFKTERNNSAELSGDLFNDMYNDYCQKWNEIA